MQLWAFGSKLKENEMSTMLEDCPPVLAAYEEFKKFSSDPVMREKVRARERYLNDERLKLAGAERKGHAEGEAKGEAKGRAAEKMETAVNMKQEGFDMAVIAKITGLPLSEIERLG
jgi:predicted transposase/invertase (TIGR01784 family)